MTWSYWLENYTLLFIYFVAIPAGYLYLSYLLVRFSWGLFTQSHYRILATGIAIIASMWLPVLSPLRAYLIYRDLAEKHAGPHIIKTVDNVERILLVNTSTLITHLVELDIYNSIEFRQNDHTPYINKQPRRFLPYAEATHDISNNNRLLYREIDTPQAQYTVTRTVNELAGGQVTILTLTIRSTTGETLGTHNTIYLHLGGIIVYSHPKENPGYVTPTQDTLSEIHFIQSVLRPRKLAPPPAAQ